LTIAPANEVASAVIGAGQAMEGGVVSTTVIVATHELVLPAPSVAVYVSGLMPNGYVAAPDGPVTVTGPTTSDAVAAPGATDAPSGDVASAVIGAGHVMEGGVVSTTVIVVTQELLLPTKSVAVYVSGVVPNGYVAAPDGPVTVTGPAMSDALAAPGTTDAPAGDVASAVTGAGHAIEGGVVSTTLIADEHELLFPDWSVAE